MGVAGGVLLGNMLADWLMPDPATGQDTNSDTDFSGNTADAGGTDVADAGGDFGGFDIGDF
jgi:hypothetical protein